MESATLFLTGTACVLSGIYRGECPHSDMILVRRGHPFPPCSKCQLSITFAFIHELTPHDAREEAPAPQD